MKNKKKLIPIPAIALTAALCSAGPTDFTATYDSGVNLEYAHDIVNDDQGNSVVLAYRNINNSAGFYIAKFSPTGDLLFTSTLDGSALEVVTGIALDANNNIYIAGRTTSDDLPMVNSMQSTKSGPSDAFIAKFDADDGTLLMSSYIGGARHDSATDIAITPDQSIVIVGQTDSIDFPTMNPIQGSLTLTDCFCDDAFVMQLSPDAQSITFSTYMGGSFTDGAEHVQIDDNGLVYVTGYTESSNFPTVSADQPIYGGGDQDAFLALLDTNTATTLYSTFVGGSKIDRITGMGLGASGNVYIGGTTRSPDMPTTPGAIQTGFAGEINGCGIGAYEIRHNCEDIFFSSYDAAGSLLNCTYLGGQGPDFSGGFIVNSDEQLLLAGTTNSTDFPGFNSPDGFRRAFVTRISSDLSTQTSITPIETNTPGDGHALGILPDGTALYGGAVGVPTGPNTIQRDILLSTVAAGECPADMNHDGTLDFFDVSMFLNAATASEPSADFTGDGQIDFFDISAFLNAFANGCP